ncbi:MAG: LamG-like jellyroll fold domain-containing protein, partial [Ferruginibacter sp.]
MKKIILFTFSCFFLLIASAQIPATNLQLWLKADAGVIKDGSNSVSEWTDQSINGRRVLQASAANQPVWFDNILNNKPVIRFDGSNDLFQAFESNGSTPLLTPATLEFTFFIAAKAVNPVSAIRYQGNGNCIAYPYTFTGASNGFISCQEGQTSGIPHGLSSSQFNVGTAIYKVNTPNGMRTYVDGLLVGQRNTGNHSTLGTDPLGIGGCLSGCAVSEFFGGDIAEIIIYDRAVSNAERIQIETYLSGKYNIIPPSPVASGLVAYYPLNGNVNDASGNSLNGTIIGTATPVADRFSIANSANSFNGSTRVEVADNALLRTTNVTMSAWVYFTNTPGTQIIAAKNLANTTFESYMLFFFNGNIAGAWGNAGTVDLLTGPVPSTNQWHLITYSFDDANDLASLYLDGALVNTKASALSIGYDNSTFSIATELESNNYGFFYNGIIDEVKIYNTALSAGQVLAEYNQANPGTTFYQDLDNDSHGNPAVSQIALTAPVGFVADSLDCNDANAAIPFTHFLYRTVASGNWNTLAIWEKNDGCNWTAANSIPSSADSSITIRTGHSVTISNALTADELTVDAGGTLEQLSNLTLANGIGDDLTVNGTWNWGSGHLIGPGIAVIANNAVLNINGGSTRFMAAANIINNGTLDWQNGRLEFTGSISSLTNNATMTISGNNSTGFNGSRLALTNNGTITKTSTGTTDLTGFTVLLNNGTFNCNAGTTTFADANAGGTFTNTGNLSFNGGTFNVNNGGTFNHNSGSVISGTGNFNNGGLMNVNVPLIFPASLLFASTGAIDGLGDLTINNDFTMQGNIYGGSGLNIKAIATWNSGHLGRNLVIDAGRVFNIAGGSARFLVAASITNNGTLDWQNGRLEFTGGNSSLLNNSIMTITGNNSTGFSGSRLALTNNGTITKTSTGATDLVGFTVFLNNGTFNCNAGTTTFADANAGGALTNTGNFIFNGGTFTVNNGGTFNHNSGSVISGTGNFNNGGLMNVNVPLVFPASLLFASTGAIDGPG